MRQLIRLYQSRKTHDERLYTFKLGIGYSLPYNLQLFAGEGADKTEEATPKRLSKAREEGQVAKSQELITSVELFVIFLILKIFGDSIGSQCFKAFEKVYTNIDVIVRDDMSLKSSVSLLNFGITTILAIALPIYLIGFFTSFLISKVQIKWKVTTQPLRPKFSKLDPLKGMKRLFSKDKLVQLLFSILKIIIISIVVYNAMKDQWGLLLNIYNFSLTQAIGYICSTVINLGMKISAIFLIIGFADLFYQKKKFKKDMRMSKQEVKDEYKNSEGDPQIKGKIKSLMLQASRRRMMNAIPEADVVITNPTHFAVALKYDRESSSAPMVVAKGADFMAQKIKEVARENDIEIVENKPLARMLYFNVEIDQEIPQELYQMVAEILAYVYRIKNKI